MDVLLSATQLRIALVATRFGVYAVLWRIIRTIPRKQRTRCSAYSLARSATIAATGFQKKASFAPTTLPQTALGAARSCELLLAEKVPWLVLSVIFLEIAAVAVSRFC